MSMEPEGLSDTARARRRRSIVTFAVVLLLLFFAVWYALSYIRADETGGTAGTPSTSTQTCLTPEQVEVNVYNATNRNGLAARVARQLEERGFDVKTVANDPKKAELENRGQLRYGAAGTKGARLVGRHTGSVEMVEDKRKRTSVDVVLGPKFQQLASESSITGC